MSLDIHDGMRDTPPEGVACTYAQLSGPRTLTRDITLDQAEDVTLAGRVLAIRDHGGVIFFNLSDRSGVLQLLCDRRRMGDTAFARCRASVAVGDIIEARGRAGRSRAGLVALFVDTIALLVKCAKPLVPAQAPADRFRGRAADLLTNPRARRALHVRSLALRAIRRCLDDEGFLECHTPVLQPRYGGGKSQPFRTYARAHECDMYLRVTSELYLKRLIVGGIEQVYEIGPCFRNEGLSPRLSAEFTMLEAYEAYAGFDRMRARIQRLVGEVVAEVRAERPEMAGELADLAGGWDVLTYREACRRHLHVSWASHDDLDEVTHALGAAGEPLRDIADAGSLHLRIVDRLLAPHFQRPTFLTALPVATSPLMRRRDDDPTELDRAWGFLRGQAFCDVAGELNDPEEQRRRLARQRGDLQGVHEYENEDPDFIDAMLLGMPPLAGVGFGVDRFLMILLRESNMREVIPFPFAMMGTAIKASKPPVPQT